MDPAKHTSPIGKFSFSSSVRDDVWHPRKSAKAYEWWYFDALSDDGTEAVAITFLDNFIYSPRYNAKEQESQDSARPVGRFPAVSFTYFAEGRPIYRSIHEFHEDEYFAGTDKPECRIGDCSFKYDSAGYGSGYVVKVELPIGGGRRLSAQFEWLSIESDLADRPFFLEENSHCWNLVAPRSDVTGRISVFNRKGNEVDTRHFRGTGYHDHNLDNRWLRKTVRDWHWGRAHFADATAVFYRYCEVDDHTPSTMLLISKDGKLQERAVEYNEQNYARDKLGIRYPTRLRLISADNVRLRVKPLTVMDSSFYYLRFLSEITLTMRDGVPRKTTGITEFLSPKTLKYRWLNWLSDVQVGKKGNAPLLPWP